MRRRWVLVIAALLVLPLVGALAGDPDDGPSERAASLGTSGETPSIAEDDAAAARARADDLARRGKHAEAAAAYEDAGLDAEADRARRRGARALYRSARRALERGRYTTAQRLATASRRLRSSAGARAVLRQANRKIAQARAAERERRRLAQIARDERTCTAVEKRAVRSGDGVPAGCATYATEFAAREAERAQVPDPGGDCDPNYAGACLKPDSPDYDCAGGSGDGPDYTGAVRVVGADPHGLDRDGDGLACEG